MDSSKVMSTEPESVKKNTLDLSSRSKWFSAGLCEQNMEHSDSSNMKPQTGYRNGHIHGKVREFRIYACNFNKTQKTLAPS